ncbi:histone deacetylase family protein [Variovorax sp. J22G21]|uniref:histone deacetylase family protein n=1 Tax=Variovorax fucosicus TaxID=3053517 RepID=UPI0025759EA5|nr:MULTISPECIES: histone deacetylase family protein [unclassified Variovorax]MDM0042504.1 histone deacetylase family protein [Variovorax sp. J22R193]MDM0061109.1 histone deacetylase family protein [Variovorax sp. J22G21]
MRTLYNDQHTLHHGKLEMFRGELVPCFEVPARADFVLQELKRRGLGAIETPGTFDDAVIARVHAPRYVDFLRGAWAEWVALDPANAGRDAFPSYWPIRTFRSDMLPASFAARMGLFSYDAGSPLTSGTWAAAHAGAGCAIAAAQRLLAGDRAAFALTRPPGHHAGADFFGGYCFLNNAAIAAQTLRDAGMARVAVLDIDYHHGNGTQAIFWERADVHFTSLHGDPHTEYPYYLGYADEQGAGAGLGCNRNLPLPRGTGFAAWREALATALQGIAAFRPDALVVSLGLDTFADDPIAGFTLQSADYLAVGEDLARTGLPTVFVFEGGYAVAEVGVNAVNVLEGFEQAA